MTDELSILAWTVVGGAPPESVSLSAARIFQLIYDHRLVPRLLYLLRRVRPTWATAPLASALLRENARAVVLHRQRVDALREVMSAGAETSGPAPLAVKGVSVFALTGDARHLRLSGDLDLFAPDPERLYQLLLRLGYTGARHPPGITEYANMRRGAVAIEVHRHLAVYAYPTGLEEADLRPEQHPGVWRQYFEPIPRQELPYAELAEHAVVSEVDWCRGLLVPDAALSALILCAHEFGETLHSPFEISIPVRLGIVADIADLARHPRFDARTFARLVAKYGAEDAVRCVVEFMRTGGVEVPATFRPYLAERPEKNRLLPRQVGFRGGWAATGSARDELLPVDRVALLDRLGPNHLRPAGGDGAPAQFPSRALVHTARGPELAPEISACWQEDRVEIEVHLPPLQEEHREYRLRADGLWDEGPRLAVNLGGENPEPVWTGTPAGEVLRTSAGFQIQFRLPVPPAAVGPEGQHANVPILLTVMRRNRDHLDFWDAEAVTVIPLRLSRRGQTGPPGQDRDRPG